MLSGLTVALLSVMVVLFGGACSWADGLLTWDQMQKTYPKGGLPFVWHLGMWGDLLILSPLLGYMVGQYGHLWSGGNIVNAYVAATIASIGMHYTYTKSAMPEAHVINHSLTAAGYVHLVYMAGALAIIFLFYFATPHPEPRFAIMASVLLTVHMIFGTHVVLGLFAPEWFPGRPLSNPATYVVILGCALSLAWRTVVLIR